MTFIASLLAQGLDPTHQRQVDITHADARARGTMCWAWLRPGSFECWGTPTDIPEEGHP